MRIPQLLPWLRRFIPEQVRRPVLGLLGGDRSPGALTTLQTAQAARAASSPASGGGLLSGMMKFLRGAPRVFSVTGFAATLLYIGWQIIRSVTSALQAERIEARARQQGQVLVDVRALSAIQGNAVHAALYSLPLVLMIGLAFIGAPLGLTALLGFLTFQLAKFVFGQPKRDIYTREELQSLEDGSGAEAGARDTGNTGDYGADKSADNSSNGANGGLSNQQPVPPDAMGAGTPAGYGGGSAPAIPNNGTGAGGYPGAGGLTGAEAGYPGGQPPVVINNQGGYLAYGGDVAVSR